MSKPNCIKCKIFLTHENRSPDRNECKPCILKKNRERNARIAETTTEKQCIKCKEIKEIRLFRSPSHRSCCVCTRTPGITEDEYKILHPDVIQRECIICKVVKPIAKFKYHYNNYRNQCNPCRNNTQNTVSLWYYNHYEEHTTKFITPQLFSRDQFYKFIKELIIQDCFYCGKQATISLVNGVDRLDSNINYSEGNCVPCCKKCNIMKKDMDIACFIRKCCEIYSYKFELLDNDVRLGYHKQEQLENQTNASYTKYSSNAKKCNRQFLLSKEEFQSIVKLDCYLCGKISKGIDRLDDNIGYTIENSKPCCKYCNFMKKKLDVVDFLEHIKKIENHTKNNTEIRELCVPSKFQGLFRRRP